MHRVQLAPADRVTATRAVLAGVVATLTLHGLFDDPHFTILVAISTVALVLDAVDGYVARRTDAATAFGARFDMEVDAFLIAVLSVHVAPYLGWWVLAIGAMRYAYVVAGRLLPWLQRPDEGHILSFYWVPLESGALEAFNLLPRWLPDFLRGLPGDHVHVTHDERPRQTP